MVSSYLNLYTSHIEEIYEDFYELLNNIYKIEFEDDINLHYNLFKTDKVPCLSLDKSYSRIKIILFNFVK